MGLNMTLEQSQAQSASVNSVCQAQVQGIRLYSVLFKTLQRILKIYKEKPITLLEVIIKRFCCHLLKVDNCMRKL